MNNIKLGIKTCCLSERNLDHGLATSNAAGLVYDHVMNGDHDNQVEQVDLLRAFLQRGKRRFFKTRLVLLSIHN